jgi:HPt (histidine-containing phosphotransfer) domain-containing protein
LFATIRETLRLKECEPVEKVNLQDLVDWPEALGYVGGDEELLRDLLETFLTQCPAWICQLEKGLQLSSPEEVHVSAHPLKNSFGLLGAKRATYLALQLENMGRCGTLTGGDETFRSLRTELDRLLPAMTDFVKSSKDGNSRG